MRSSLSNPASPSTLNFQGVTVSLILAERDLTLLGLRNKSRVQTCIRKTSLAQDMREFVRCPPDQAAHGGIACTRAFLHDVEKNVPPRLKGVDCPKHHGTRFTRRQRSSAGISCGAERRQLHAGLDGRADVMPSGARPSRSRL